jgi:hypothetical protein
VTDRENDLRRAAAAVNRSIAMGPDDDAHPAYELLEALVDGRLEAADQESVQSHVETCRICAEDVTDMSGMRDAMRASAPVTAPRTWRPYMVAVASIAAVLIMAVWLGNRPASPGPSNTIATGPAPSPTSVPAARASSLDANEQAIVARVTETGRLNLPASLSELTGSVGTLLGTSRERLPLSPIGPVGTAVLSVRPTFSWHALPGAISYSIAVYDDSFNEVARSPRLDAPTWTPVKALPTGRKLAWQITASLATGDVTGPAPPQPEARFLVIDSAAAATIGDQLTRLANEPLALGILLAEAGLVDEASQALERAAADAATRQQAQPLLEQLKRR